jgi:hypothetical protein
MPTRSHEDMMQQAASGMTTEQLTRELWKLNRRDDDRMSTQLGRAVISKELDQRNPVERAISGGKVLIEHRFSSQSQGGSRGGQRDEDIADIAEHVVASCCCSDPGGFVTKNLLVVTNARLGWGPRHLFTDTPFAEFTWVPLVAIGSVSAAGVLPPKLRLLLRSGDRIELATQDAKAICQAVRQVLP